MLSRKQKGTCRTLTIYIERPAGVSSKHASSRCLFVHSAWQGAADRIAERVSSLETQVLDGRSALASAVADRDGMVSELKAAREVGGRAGELKVAVLEATAREEALRVEMASLQSALKVKDVIKLRVPHFDIPFWFRGDGHIVFSISALRCPRCCRNLVFECRIFDTNH